ncbi:MAG: hypothetical protein PF442_00105 [Desulfobulbaceae bacterium]|jgi:hypothetical protein|nr:hypothetical protein [Desulfobulbaceae bacterium]
MSELNPNEEVLFKLKSAVLNIDWEISDETLTELAEEVAKLQGKWAGKKVLLVYLQIIGALCQYIGVSRGKSHPGTFLLLKEAFNGLETVVMNPAMDQAEQSKDLMAYAERYNQLKKEISAGDFIPGPPKDEGEEKSTIDRLLDADEGHAADTVFDSLLSGMVQSPEDDKPEKYAKGPEPEVAAPTSPPARPPVQAAFNKADGTEVYPDRNEDDEFSEADKLLDDFFGEDEDEPVVDKAKDGETEELDVVPSYSDEEQGGVEDTWSIGASVENLQMLLLSVDEEVDEQLLQRLEEEVDSMSEAVKDNVPARIHVSLLGAVIRYIGREHVDVIHASMTCLQLIADSLENLMQDQTGAGSHYSEVAVQAFTDWHELVVLEFENRLARCSKVPESVSEPAVGGAVEDTGNSLDSPLPQEIQRLKADILKEVKEMLVQGIAELKS